MKQGAGADSASVAFDAVQAARARGADVLLVDTAGRLHTKTNLMEEIKKVVRVIGKALPGAPHEVLLVLDATTGQNGLVQAREFHSTIGLTGLVLTKLDGTAKGASSSRSRATSVFPCDTSEPGKDWTTWNRSTRHPTPRRCSAVPEGSRRFRSEGNTLLRTMHFSRVLESEVMDDPAQASAYAMADFADVNRAFVERFLTRFPDVENGTILDLGCGPVRHSRPPGAGGAGVPDRGG